MIAANNNFVLAFDNLSHLTDWSSDALCRLATRGGSGTRALYTDADEFLIDVQRPVIINGIAELATRPDLLDRAFLTRCGPMTKKRYLDDDAIWRRFQEAQPWILGALLDAVSMALKRVDTTEIVQKPRMVDCARWVTAAEPVFGWTPESFLESYMQNAQDANITALEASP